MDGIVFLGVILVVAFGLMVFLFFALKKEGDGEVGPGASGGLKGVFVPEKKGPVLASSAPKMTPVLRPSLPVGDPQGSSPNKGQRELDAVREKAALELAGSAEKLGALQRENEQLRADVERLQVDMARVQDAEQRIQDLRAENVAFKAQLEMASVSARDQVAAFEAAREDLAARLLAAQEAVAHLEVENASLRPAAEAVVEKENTKIVEDVAALRKEKEELEARLAEMERAQTAKDEENKFLQYELTKSRAQAAGLERICEGTKKQFENMARETHGGAPEKVASQGASDSLEKSLNDFRRVSEGVSRAEISGHPDEEGKG